MLDLREVVRRGIDVDREEKNFLSYFGWVMSTIRGEDKPRPDGIHVSDYNVNPDLPKGDQKCKRALWLREHDAESKKPTLGERIMWDHGKMIQFRFSWYIYLGLPDDWEVIGIEVEVDEFMPEDDSGSVDLVLRGPNERIVCVEMKTQRGRAFQYKDEVSESHASQANGYGYGLKRKYDSEEDIELVVFYLDREGQNPPIQFPVEYDEEKVEKSSELANSLIDEEKPDMMEAGIEIKENKTCNNSVYIDFPWQCSYCDFIDISCDSPLRPEHRIENKVGEITDNGEVAITKDVPDEENLREFIEQSLERGNVSYK